MDEMNERAEMIFNTILNQMDDETKNTLIKTLATHDKNDVWIQAVPVYEDVCHEGNLLMRYIKEIKYCVSVKHDVDNLIEKEYHAIWLK